jgi:polysaccharide lyase-like protein
MKAFIVNPILSLLAVCGMAVVSSTAANAQAALIFSDDFESGSLAEADWKSVGGHPPVVQSAKSRAGGHALKSTLRFFNGAGASPLLRERVEVRALAPETEVGREYWYGFSIYLPGVQDGADNFVADRYWEVVAQWQGVTDTAEEQGRNPALTIATSVQGNGGRWHVSGRSSARPINGKGENDTSFSIDLGPYETGEWTDWVFRIKWSYRDDGILEVWKDGMQVISRVNAPIGYNDRVGPYFKMGIYKGSWESLPENGSGLDVVDHRVVYHDEFRMADETGSYADVAPGGTGIVPKPPTALRLGN